MLLLRRLALLVSALAVMVGLLSAVPLPSAVADPTPGSPAGAMDSDVPTSPAVPLPTVQSEADPAESIESLPAQTGGLPTDEVAGVDLEPGWTDVPGMPVEVQVDDAGDDGSGGSWEDADGDESTGPMDPPSAESAPEDDPADGLTTESPDGSSERALPTDDPSSSPSTDPSDDPSDGPSSAPDAGVSPAATPDVVVELTQSETLQPGVLALSIQAPVAGLPIDPEIPVDPDNEPSASPTDPPDAPTSSPTEALSTSDPAPTEPAVPTDEALVPAVGVDVRLDYAAFDTAYGGGWSDRLVVTAYPDCVLTTPELEECSTGVEVDAVNDPATQTLTFETLPDLEGVVPEIEPEAPEAPAEPAGPESGGPTEDPSGQSVSPTSPSEAPSTDETQSLEGGAGQSRVVGELDTTVSAASAMSAGSGSTPTYTIQASAGSYASTPATASGEWQVGAGSGEFSYSYPFQLPTALGGATPSLGLSYSSAVVDGTTAAENGQASPAGLGWDLTSPGYVSRSFVPCKFDGVAGKGDMCWRGGQDPVQKLSLNIGGQSATLVRDGASSRYRLREDESWRVRMLSVNGGQFSEADGTLVPSNDDDNNEAFLVQSPDGTKYYFGLGRGGGSQPTNSVWTMPVYGNDAGEPCYSASAAAKNRYCKQAWRWNLDRVVDLSGNETRYFYETESNYYARWATGGQEYLTKYDRAGMLTRVEYGFDGGQPRQVVSIDSAQRCTTQLSNPGASCAGTNGPRAKPSIWPDVPGDLICDATDYDGAGGGSQCLNGSPSFFSTKRYDRVITKTVAGGDGNGGGYAANVTTRNVNEYKLGYTMPDPDGTGSANPDDPELWLNTITRTGYGANGTRTANPVNFNGIALQNRVTPAGGRKYMKFRIDSIRNENGGRIEVVYGHAAHPSAGTRKCDADYVNGLNRWGSNRECFASWWNPPSGEARWEWFHKYVVTRLALSDDALGYRLTNFTSSTSGKTNLAQMRVYDYDYQGDPAWRYVNQPGEPENQQGWTDWRGYGVTKVATRNIEYGTNGMQNVAPGSSSIKRISVYRGMYGTKKSPTSYESDGYGAKIDTLEKSAADEPFDQPWFAGLVAEEAIFDTRSGNEVQLERTYSEWNAFTTADNGNRQARIRWLQSTRHSIREFGPSGGATGTEQAHVVTYDVNKTTGVEGGAVRRVEDRGDPDDPNDTTCTYTDWQNAQTLWLRVPSATETWRGACGAEGTGKEGPGLLSRVRNYYDGDINNIEQGLTRGLLTGTRNYYTVNGAGGGGLYIENRMTYDGLGRVTRTAVGNPDDTGWTVTTYNPNGNPRDVLTEIQTTSPSISHPTIITDDPSADTTSIKVRQAPGERQSLTSSQSLDPRTGLPTKTVDENGNLTFLDYDPLGRLNEVRLPGSLPSETPNVRYVYEDNLTSPSSVHTITLRDRGLSRDPGIPGAPTFDHAYSYYDGWGRLVETQTPQPGVPGDRMVAVTGYDNQGRVAYDMPVVPNGSDPGSGVLNPSPDAVARYTRSTYDAAGRATKISQMTGLGTGSTNLHFVLTDYLGDRTIAEPSEGGSTRTMLDVEGQPTSVQLLEDTTPPPGRPIPTNPAVLDSVNYQYDPLGRLTQATKYDAGTPATGAESTLTWTYGYDLLGRKTLALDPDTGATKYDYDTRGNLRTTTSSSTFDGLSSGFSSDGTPNRTTSTYYDEINRPLFTYTGLPNVGATTAPARDRILNTWSYDIATFDRSAAFPNAKGRLVETTTNLADPSDTRGSDASIADLTGDPTTSAAALPDRYRVTIGAYDQRGNPLSSTDHYPAWAAAQTGNASGMSSYTTKTSYNELGAPTEAETPAIADLPATTQSFDYTNGGALAATSLNLNVANGAETIRLAELDYNNVGQVNQLDSGTRTGGDRFERNFSYYAATGRIEQLGAVSYDGNDAYNPLFLTYDRYDERGNPLRINGFVQVPTTDGRATSYGAWCYQYDDLSRLTNAKTGVAGATNGAGCASPTSASRNVTGTDYDLTYTYHRDRLTSTTESTNQGAGAETGSVTSTYHNGGAALGHQTDLITLTPNTSSEAPDSLPEPGAMTYNGFGQITTWQPGATSSAGNTSGPDAGLPTGAAGLDDSALTYRYDGQGRLRAINSASQILTHAYNSAGLELIRATRPADDEPDDNAEIKLTLSDGTAIDTELPPSGASGDGPISAGSRQYSADGVPIANYASEALPNNGRVAPFLSWLFADHLGSIRLTQSRLPGPVEVKHANYYPFGYSVGETSVSENTSTIDTQSTEAHSLPSQRGYLGKEHDENGDLVLDHRRYPAQLGIFSTPDPLLLLSDPQSYNPYSYSRNNPIALSDPSGLHYDADTGASGDSGIAPTGPSCGANSGICSAPVASTVEVGDAGDFWGGLALGALDILTLGPEIQTTVLNSLTESDVTLPSEYTTDWAEGLGIDTDSLRAQDGRIIGSFIIPIPGLGLAAGGASRGVGALARGAVGGSRATHTIAKTSAITARLSGRAAHRVNEAVPDPLPVYRPDGSRMRGRNSSPWFVSYRDGNGAVQTMGNAGPGGMHAEARIQQLFPGTQMSRPFGWRNVDGTDLPQWVPGTVCANCQIYPPSLFAPGTRGAPGGPWDQP